MEKYIIHNNHIVYHKGYFYFGFGKDDRQMNWESKTYDNLDSAKRALRRLKKEDNKFYRAYIILGAPIERENWKIAVYTQSQITEYN